VNDAPLMMSVSGMRGISGKSLDDTVIRKYVSACADFLEKHSPGECRIVLGRDGRAGGEKPAQIAARAWLARGFEVIDLGVAATPTTAFMVKDLQAAGGMEVTASHNPARWNGLKLFTREGRAPFAREAETIIAAYQQDNSPLPPLNPAAPDPVKIDDAAERHVARVLAHVDVKAIRQRRFRVVLDSVNASGSRGALTLLQELGCTVVPLHCAADGVFPHNPEPTAENLQGLCEAVKKENADVGFAQDPDADRLAVVDNRGSYIGEEYTLVLAAREVLQSDNTPGEKVIVANLSTSRMIDDLAAETGNVSVRRSKVGEANVVAAMLQYNAVVGGEGNGGVILPGVVLVRDSLVAMALVLSLIARNGKTLQQTVARMPAYAIVKRKLPVREGLAEKAVARLAQEYAREKTDLQDGIRVDFARSWLHVRPSNTEPILRLIAEAPRNDEAEQIINNAEKLINQL